MAKYSGEIWLIEEVQAEDEFVIEFQSLVTANVDFKILKGTKLQKEDIKAALQIAFKKYKRPATPMLQMRDFPIQTVIANGNYGRVFMAKSKKFGLVALRQRNVGSNELTELWKERDMMIWLEHDRILHLHAAFYDKDVFFATDLCYGSVACLRDEITPRNAVRFAVQLLQGLDWLHVHNIAHCQLTPANCLISLSNNLLISNFRCAFNLEDRPSVLSRQCHGMLGYLDYKAIKNLEFSTSTDVFSAACIIFEMETKDALLYYADQIQTRELYVDALENGRIKELPPTENFISTNRRRETLFDRVSVSHFQDLLRKLIKNDDRFTASEALLDSNLIDVLRENGVRIRTLDNDKGKVTKEIKTVPDQVFHFYTDHSPMEVKLALESFYFENHN